MGGNGDDVLIGGSQSAIGDDARDILDGGLGNDTYLIGRDFGDVTDVSSTDFQNANDLFLSIGSALFLPENLRFDTSNLESLSTADLIRDFEGDNRIFVDTFSTSQLNVAATYTTLPEIINQGGFFGTFQSDTIERTFDGFPIFFNSQNDLTLVLIDPSRSATGLTQLAAYDTVSSTELGLTGNAVSLDIPLFVIDGFENGNFGINLASIFGNEINIAPRPEVVPDPAVPPTDPIDDTNPDMDMGSDTNGTETPDPDTQTPPDDNIDIPEAPIALTLNGTDGDENITGGAGNDTINAGAGDDTIIGGAGADTIDGGEGFDVASYFTSNADVIVDLLTGTGSGGDAEGDTLINIEDLNGSNFDDRLSGDDSENFIFGEEGNDTIEGRDGDDLLDGNGGNDIIFGGLGDDRIFGGFNDDILTGGSGADQINGNDGFDLASYFDSNAAVTIDLEQGIASGGHATGDVLTSIEDLDGSFFADTLLGDAIANYINGHEGDDTINGRAGDDRLDGNDGGDSIFGGTGNDRLSGDAGNDTLSGGEGADIFVFNGSFDNDVINDFEAGIDRIEVSSSQFSTFSDIQTNSQQIGNNVVISHSDGTISIENFQLDDLTQSSVLFA